MKDVKELIRHLKAMKSNFRDKETQQAIDYALEKAEKTEKRLKAATEILKEIQNSL